MWEAIQKEAMNKSVTKSKAKRLRAITLRGAIGIIKKINNLVEHHFARILGAPILFLPSVFVLYI